MRVKLKHNKVALSVEPQPVMDLVAVCQSYVTARYLIRVSVYKCLTSSAFQIYDFYFLMPVHMTAEFIGFFPFSDNDRNAVEINGISEIYGSVQLNFSFFGFCRYHY